MNILLHIYKSLERNRDSQRRIFIICPWWAWEKIKRISIRKSDICECNKVQMYLVSRKTIMGICFFSTLSLCGRL